MLFWSVFTAGLSQVLANPNKLKSALDRSNVYSTLVTNIIEQSSQNLQEGDSSSDSLPIDDPAIKEAANKAFSDEFLRTSTNNFIDGTFRWLNGDVTTPDFKIDINAAKLSFADNLGTYAKERVAALPVCTAEQTTQYFDLFTATCKPAGFNVDAEIQKAKDDILTKSDGPFSQSTITADNFKGDDSNGTVWATNLQHVPEYYQWLKKAPIIFGVLALLSGAGVILLSAEHRKGMKRIGIILAITGALTLLFAWSVVYAVERLSDASFQGENATVFKDTITSFGSAITSDLSKLVGIYGGVYILLAAIMFGVLYLTRPSPVHYDSGHKRPEVPGEPKKSEGDASKPSPEAAEKSEKKPETKV
jgi:hypothetical protein